MRRINPNLYPREGFHFKDSTGVRIGAGSWPGVIARVVQYRQRNGFPPGDPEAEVMAQACDRNPGLCTDENQAYKSAVVRASLKNRVLLWLLQMRTRREKENIGIVVDQDARNRAQVCSTCPRNQSLPEGCSTCRQAVEESRRQIVGSRFTDARVHACDVLGEEINTSMHLDLIRIDHPELPGHCWRKRVL